MNKNRIDGNIEFGNSEFKFNKEVTSIFEDHVRKSVPLYDEVQSMVSQISDWFVEDGTSVFDIGTSTGECISRIYNRHSNRNVNFVGIDTSKDMIKKAKEVHKNLNINFLENNICDEEFNLENASFITSILTLQFIPLKDRQMVINKIYNGLNNGSAFVVFEKVEDINLSINTIYSDLYSDFKLNNGFKAEEVINKTKSIRGIMRPISMDENLKMFVNAGFRQVSIFCKWGNFVGLIMIK